ncbi:hypothetical protein HMPREF0063_12319 [Aeromicrobium marinum DSM 15272]|uniref:WXG100 family type VII secretion target n=1 Tax=Aeromicrobium marinum DSM 15272 TaxID=585531 RepID=E2SD07_9ACTN|nr:hypothetical protein [Aeromicrobium marinum]EFQ83110.1 hypothetical protein HMPREF0063_12319 [Aeromicrobium marinum DSM 15272]
MGDADLRVDYYRLEESERVLATLKSDFDNIKDDTSNSVDVWSHADVADAMGDFQGNMDYNRRKLSEKISDCGEKIAATLETFREADQDLADSFDEERQ